MGWGYSTEALYGVRLLNRGTLWGEVTQQQLILMNRLNDTGGIVRNFGAIQLVIQFQLHHKLSKCAWMDITQNKHFHWIWQLAGIKIFLHTTTAEHYRFQTPSLKTRYEFTYDRWINLLAHGLQQTVTLRCGYFHWKLKPVYAKLRLYGLNRLKITEDPRSMIIC